MTKVTFKHFTDDRTWGPHFMNSVPEKDDFVRLDDEDWWVSRVHWMPETADAVIIVTPPPWSTE